MKLMGFLTSITLLVPIFIIVSKVINIVAIFWLNLLLYKGMVWTYPHGFDVSKVTSNFIQRVLTD
jgi:hypothetical protein